MRASLLVLPLFSSLALAAGVGDYVVQQQFTLGGPGGWDYLTVDPAAERLFISRADRVLVVDLKDRSLVATIPDTPGVHGIALAPELGEGFTSNGRADTVTVFDLASLKPKATIEVGGHNPDAILYDKASRKLFTFNGKSQDVSIIDPGKATVLTKIPVGGKPEFAASDDKGRVFFNIEDTSQLGVIDSFTSTLIAKWSLANCEEPTGLALDVEHGRLFSVCGNSTLVVTDAASGKQIATVPIGKGPDAVSYDAERRLIFSSNGQDGTLTVIHEDDPGHYAVIGTVATQKSARTMALDPATHRVYLVAAQFGPQPEPTADVPHPRPSVLDGSFKVMVVGN
jgi:YVTN family beta-propeller protein